MQVRCCLKELLEERNLSIRRTAADIGVHFESLRRLHNNETDSYSRELISKLCEYLELSDVGQLLKLEQ